MAIWRVTVAGELYGVERWANVFHVDKGPAVDPGDVTAIFEDWYGTPGAGGGLLKYSTGNGFSGPIAVHASQISMQAVVTPAPPFIDAVDINGGQNTDGGLPVDCSVVISWRTALAGRSYRGRTYLPPWNENTNSDVGFVMPRPSTAAITDVIDGIEWALEELVTVGAPLVVYSRKLGSAQTVTGGYIDDAWDTQRGRSKSQPTSRFQFTTP